MSNYLFIVNVGDNIVSSVHISKFVPNKRAKFSEYIDFKVGVYTQTKNNVNWKKIDEVSFNGENNIKLSSSDYNLEIGQLAVVIPCAIGFELKESLRVLPKPLSRKVDLAQVSERATISFERGKAVSSYQGDFPYQMSKVKGTFLAFDALAFNSHKGINNKLILINIFSQELTEKKQFSLHMINSITKENIKKQAYIHNSAAIMNFDCNKDLSYIFYSKDTLGIPIFISYHEDFDSNLSVEHAHPPAEYFFGESKFIGQQELKSNWLSKLT
ncbi:MAG: hypothetical protein QF864_10435 [SAR202 cluster bacterium]|nr:hypothetical protein [SAR202 cluster bacterium]